MRGRCICWAVCGMLNDRMGVRGCEHDYFHSSCLSADRKYGADLKFGLSRTHAFAPMSPPNALNWSKLSNRTRLATSVCQFRHDRTEQCPTEPHAGRSTFLLSSGGAGGGYY
jgi:hypothetical protein